MTVVVGAAVVILATAPAAASTPRPETQVHEVPAFRTHLFFLAGTTISSGASTSGYLVVDNTAKVAMPVNLGCPGRPSFGVVLTNAKVQQSVVFPMVACSSIPLAPGRHRYPFTLYGSFNVCRNENATSNASGIPTCVQPGDRPPPLPIGSYRAVMQTIVSLPVPKPVPFKVISPRPNLFAYRSAPAATTPAVPDLVTLRDIARRVAASNNDPVVHHGYVVLTTREHAAGGDIVNGDQPVYEIVLQGHFTCGGCSFPPGASAPTGTVVIATIDRSTLQGTDFGITRSLPTVLVGEPVYRFGF